MDQIQFYLNDLGRLLAGLPVATIRRVVDRLLAAYHADRRLILLGNGGSAADAQHGIGLELGAVGFLVAVDSVEQADHAGLDQVIDFHAGRQFRLHVVGETLHQRHVLRQ